jgi:hypothetical protein
MECLLPRAADVYLDLTLYRAYTRAIERRLLGLFRVTAGNNLGFRPALVALTGWPPTSPRLFVNSGFIGWGFCHI